MAYRKMETLRKILLRANKGLEDGWLYLPENESWSLDTKGKIIDVDELPDNEVDDNEEPLIAKEKGLISTLDSGTIESIVSFANNIEAEISDALLLESFIYYYDYDAFLPESGFKPLPREEHLLKMDRDFYNSLGEEREEIKCKNESCERGAIKGSLFCRIHHFEMINKKPCPFTD
jgi:hypothetical protein